jgi:hypothetical protein
MNWNEAIIYLFVCLFILLELKEELDYRISLLVDLEFKLESWKKILKPRVQFSR